ncbi:hypothetical protein EON64_19120, partial [archaeon]
MHRNDALASVSKSRRIFNIASDDECEFEMGGEFFDSNIQSLLANPPSGQRHASFIPVFKFLRSYGWYYDD